MQVERKVILSEYTKETENVMQPIFPAHIPVTAAISSSCFASRGKYHTMERTPCIRAFWDELAAGVHRIKLNHPSTSVHAQLVRLQ